MRWARAAVVRRLICLILGIASIGVAWQLTRMGRIDDVPPPFIVLAGLVGLGFLSIAVTGRYPGSSD